MTPHFRIVAVADPQTLPRIMGVFAQRTLMPTTLSCQRRGGMFQIDLAFNHLDAPTAAIIAAKLAESILVASVVCGAAAAATKNARRSSRPDIIAAA